jgi:hypothetical protein
VVEAAAGDPAGGDGVDAHAAGGPLDGGGLGEVDHAGAGGPGVAHAGHAAPHVGDDVDDRAAVLAMRLGEDLAGEQEAADEVGAHDGLEALLRDRGQRRGELAAGVVDEAVDAAVGGDDGGDGGLDGGLVADVAGVPVGGAAVLGDLGGDGESFARLRPMRTTWAPSAASSCAVQRPMPLPPPVTTTTLTGEQALAEDGAVGAHGGASYARSRVGKARAGAAGASSGQGPAGGDRRTSPTLLTGGLGDRHAPDGGLTAGRSLVGRAVEAGDRPVAGKGTRHEPRELHGEDPCEGRRRHQGPQRDDQVRVHRGRVPPDRRQEHAEPPSSNDDAPADCTVKVSLEDFGKLMERKLDPMTAFMTGKIKIEGDMGVAMKLGNLFKA